MDRSLIVSGFPSYGFSRFVIRSLLVNAYDKRCHEQRYNDDNTLFYLTFSSNRLQLQYCIHVFGFKISFRA